MGGTLTQIPILKDADYRHMKAIHDDKTFTLAASMLSSRPSHT